MVKLLQRAAVVLVGLGLLGSVAGASPLFLPDWGVSYGNWAPVGSVPQAHSWWVEDYISGNNGYLGPGYGGNEFDVEALYIGLDSNYLYLAVITGMPLGGRDGWGGHYTEHYDPGDMALDITGDGVYDYAVDVSAAGALRSGNLVWENPMIEGGPAWGGVADPLRVTSWSNTESLAGYRYGSFSGRYAIEAMIDRAAIAPITGSVKLHWTMECGNDVGDLVHPIPEPATLLLLGGGLVATGVLKGRRKRNR